MLDVSSATTLNRSTAAPAQPAAANRLDLRTLQALGRVPTGADAQATREAASQLLSELFFKPMLAEVRKFPIGREWATGGRVESIFGERLDERIADSVANRAEGVVAQLVRDLAPPGSDRATWPARAPAAAPAEGDPA